MEAVILTSEQYNNLVIEELFIIESKKDYFNTCNIT